MEAGKYNPPVCLEEVEKQVLVMPVTNKRMSEIVLEGGKENICSSCSLLPSFPDSLIPLL